MALVFIGLAVLFALLLLGQARELLFYRNNGWDFSVDSNINWLKIRSSRPPEYLATNRERVCFARPFIIVCVGAITAGSGHITFHPEQWRKEVHGSRVTYYYIGTPQPDGH